MILPNKKVINKVYLAISYSKKNHFKEEIEYLENYLKKKDVALLVFVNKYSFSPTEERSMMETAFKEIKSSDILIAELTYKAIGVGIEVGYAYANQKPIVYIRKEGSDLSTTVSGCADISITYKGFSDFKNKIDSLFKDLF